ASATEDDRQYVVHAGSVSPPAAPRYFGADLSGLLLRRTITVTSFLLCESCLTRAKAGLRRAKRAPSSPRTPYPARPLNFTVTTRFGQSPPESKASQSARLRGGSQTTSQTSQSTGAAGT